MPDKMLRDIADTLWPKEEETMAAKCIYCGGLYLRDHIFQHMWDLHREEMLKARRERGDCKSAPVSDLLNKYRPPKPRTGTLDNPDSLGDTVKLRSEDAVEEQDAVPRGSKYFWPQGLPAMPVEDRLLTKLDRLEQVVQKLQQRRLDIKMALLEVGEGFLSLASLRITKG